MCFLPLAWYRMEKMPQAFSSHQKAGQNGDGARGEEEMRPSPLSPFPFPATGFHRLYETDLKSSSVRECIF